MRHHRVLVSAFQSSRKKITFTSEVALSSKATNESASPGSDNNKHAQVLKDALPQLKARFNKLAEKNDEGVFPILSPAIAAKMKKRWDPDDHERRAAVLIPLYSDNGIPSILFTARSPDMPSHPSEISFVGGHQEEGETVEETALREAQEELLGNYPWHDPEKVVVLGTGTTIPAITGTPVTPVIAVMLDEIDLPLSDFFPGCNNEVDAVFGMPVAELLQIEDSHKLPNHRLLEKNQNGPMFPSPHGNIWGLTAFMLRPLLHKLYKPVFKLRQK